MEREHALQWLDREPNDPTSQALVQIQEEWNANHFPAAIRLCEHLVKRAEELQQHDSQGIAYCYLGETYRLMGIHQYQNAVEAFGKARVHFSLDGTPASNRNKGIAYWSLAMTLEQLPSHWNDALRYYQSALDTIERELDEIRSQSAPPRSHRARLVQELGDIRQLIAEDQENLLRQQTMGDPKIVGLMRQLVAAEHRFQEAEKRVIELVERTEKAALVATKATQHAYFAAQAANAVQTASDSVSRKALHAARHINRAVDQLEQSIQDLQAAVGRIEAAANSITIASQDSLPDQPIAGPGRRHRKET
jgi:tetratricopeptide (TPR) repeat protein